MSLLPQWHYFSARFLTIRLPYTLLGIQSNTFVAIQYKRSWLASGVAPKSRTRTWGIKTRYLSGALKKNPYSILNWRQKIKLVKEGGVAEGYSVPTIKHKTRYEAWESSGLSIKVQNSHLSLSHSPSRSPFISFMHPTVSYQSFSNTSHDLRN